MQRHTSNYYTKFNYTSGDIILCELCGKVAVDIHHVIPRSHFGSRRKEEQDNWTNLIALCHPCHHIAHNGPKVAEFNERIRQFVKSRNENTDTSKAH